MARLIDHMRVGIKSPRKFLELQSQTRWGLDGMRNAIQTAQPIVADNVVEHYYAAKDRGLDHMPPLIPPFEDTWIEAKSGGALYGMLYSVETMPEHKHPVCDRLAIAWLFTYDKMTQSALGPIIEVHIAMDGKGNFDPQASVGLAHFQEYLDDEYVRREALTMVENGKPKDYTVPVTDWWGGELTSEDNIGVPFEIVKSLLLAVGMMNCSNVGTVQVEPPPKLSKKRKKRYGHPLTTYRVIRVTPHFTQKGRKKHSDETIAEGSQPLHIVRGHFKTYEEDRPLFGRYAGTFWWNSQVRGSRDSGEVLHDYEVDG
jgi:hypothetical protein